MAILFLDDSQQCFGDMVFAQTMGEQLGRRAINLKWGQTCMKNPGRYL